MVRHGLSEDDIRKLLQSTRALSAPEESKTVNDSDPPSVSELIRKSKEDPASLPPLNIPPNSLEDLKRLLGERFSRNKLNKRPAWVNRIRNYLPSDVRDELRQSGLEQVVTEIVDNVREDPQEASSGVSNAHNRSKQPPSAASPNSNNGRYGKSLQDRLSELTKALRSRPPSREKPTSANSPQKPTANDSPRSTKDKDDPSVAKRFTDFYQSFTRRDDNKSSASGKALVSGSYLSFEIVVAGLAICVLGGCLLYFGTRGDARHPAQPTLTRLDAKQISSREDLIRAFHFLTHSCDSSAENWWSHRRAARLLAATRPTALSDVETLTNLYEVARYSPDHDTLSETEFRIARRAVESLIQ